MTEVARLVVLILGGVVFGLGVASIVPEAHVAFRDGRRVWGIIMIRVGVVGLVGAAMAELALRLPHDHLTWRTPVFGIVFALLAVGIAIVMSDDLQRADGYRTGEE